MSLNCRLPNFKDSRFVYKEFDPTAPPDIVKKINWFQHRWEAMTRMHPRHPFRAVQADRQLKFWDRLVRIGNMVEADRFSPAMRRAIETRSVNRIAQGYKMVQDFLNNPSTVKGATADALIGFERRARGFIADAISDIEVAKVASQYGKTAREIGKKYKLTADEVARMQWDVLELSIQPYVVEESLDVSAPMYKLLDIRQGQVKEWLDTKGIEVPDQERIVDAAKQLAQVNAEMVAIAGSVGLEIAELKDMGYLHRVFTREASDIMETIKEGGIFRPSGRPIVLESSKAVNTAFQKGRQFFDFVYEDAQVLDYLFKKGGVFEELNKKLQTDDVLRASLGKDKVEDFIDLLEGENDMIISHAFINVLDQDELQTLIELGFIHKVPWQTSKVHRYYQETFQLPFGLADTFVSDPAKVTDLYVKSLQAVAGERGKVWGYFKGALQDGWGVPEGLVMADPKKYPDYVPLTEAFPPSMADSIFGTDQEAAYHLGKTYVPREAAGLIHAELKMSTDPLQLGLFGNVMSVVHKWGTGLMLTTSQYLGRQIWGWGGALVSRGVSPLGYYTHIVRQMATTTFTKMKGLPAMNYGSTLSDVRRWGGGKYSGKDLWKRAVERGLINDFNIFGEVNQQTHRTLKRTIQEFLTLNKLYPEHFGDNVWKVGGKAFKELFADNAPFVGYLAYANTVTDNFGKFALLEALLSDHRRIVPEILDPIPHFTDVDDAIEYVFKNTWQFDKLNVGAAKWNNHPAASALIPFLNWRLVNIQQSAQYAIAHPHLFGSYLYLIARPNEELEDEVPEEYALVTSSWIDNLDFPKWFVTDGESSPTGRREWFMFPSTNWMPYLGAISDIGDIMDTLGLFNKSKLPSRRNDNPYEKQVSVLQRAGKELTLPVVEAASAFYTQRDGWGRTWDEIRASGKKRTLLGFEIDPVAHYFITTLAPAIKALDRNLSYTGATGTAPTVDPITGVYKEGTPSWTGAIPDYPVASQSPHMWDSQFFNGVLQAVGAAPYHIDVYLQAQYKITDITYQLYEAEDRLKAYPKKMAQARDEEHAKQIREKAENDYIWAVFLAQELGYYEMWRKKVGLTHKRATDAILQQNLQVSELLSEEEKAQVRADITKRYKNSNYFNPQL